MSETTTTAKQPFISDKAYKTLRIFLEIILPAFGVLYAALAGIWGLPFSEQVIGTAAAIGVFGGVLIRINKKRYDALTKELQEQDPAYDGRMIVNTTDVNKDVYTLDLHIPVADIQGKTNLNLKVVDEDAAAVPPAE